MSFHRELRTENEFVSVGAGRQGARRGGGAGGERARLQRAEDDERQAREHRVRGREQELEQLAPRVVRNVRLRLRLRLLLRLGRGGQGGGLFGERPYSL